MRIAPWTSQGRVPTAAFLQLSDRCNHACSHCYQVHGERGELTTEEVMNLLEDMAASGVLFVTLTGGEVTLRHDFLDVVARARRLSFAVRIYTNAYRIDDALAAALAALGVLEVHVSVYSARAGDHDSVTLVPGSFEKTLAGIRALRRHGTKVVMKMPFMNINSGTYQEVIALAHSLGCQYTIDPTVDVREDGHSATTAMRASQAALDRLVADPALGLPGRGAVAEERPMDEQPCGACAVAYVSPDGTMRPCSSLPFSLGNVRDTSYAAAYNDSPAAKFVQSLTWHDLPACSVCELRGYCGRCHASALLEDGDMFGPASSSCQWAKTRFHHVMGSRPDELEPDVGPFRVTEEGRLLARTYERVTRTIPDEVRSALVVGKGWSSGAEPGRKVRLRVLSNG